MTSELDELGTTIDTDILILGSGAAGCGAAIAAREHGARVVLVDKGKIESSGALGGGNDHFMAVLHSGPETDTEEAVIKFYKGPTSGYTAEMISRWVQSNAPHAGGFAGNRCRVRQEPGWLMASHGRFRAARQLVGPHQKRSINKETPGQKDT